MRPFADQGSRSNDSRQIEDWLDEPTQPNGDTSGGPLETEKHEGPTFHGSSFEECEKVRMNDAHSAICISLAHDAGDVDLARSCSQSAPQDQGMRSGDRKKKR